MDFTTRHERELDEIKSLTQQLERRTHECSGQLGRIERAQREALSDDRHEPVLAFVHIPKTAPTRSCSSWTTGPRGACWEGTPRTAFYGSTCRPTPVT